MERMLLQLGSAQQAAGHRVSILAIHGGPLHDEAQRRSLHVHILSGGRFARSISAARHFWVERPDIVHVHNPTSLRYAALSKLNPKASIVVTLHGDQDTHARLGTDFEWWLTSAAVVVSRAAVATLRLSRRAGPLTVIHNGIARASVTTPRHVPSPHMAGPQVFLGIMVARMDGRKGHHTLVRSLHQLKETGISVRVLVVGDGIDRTNIEERAREYGLGHEDLQFLGRRSDIEDLLSAADFFVLPSDIEGVPMAILEAMAHGLPIIASKVGGIPEVIDDERDGLLIPPGDPPALAAAIQRLASDTMLRRSLGSAALARVSREFSLKVMASKYDRVYADAMARRRITR
jgi:glycosyltransferase involved in cell wall biosynthesis